MALENFQNEITKKDIINKLNQDPNADPNANYEILHNILDHAKEKHMPRKTVKFNKRKQKIQMNHFWNNNINKLQR